MIDWLLPKLLLIFIGVTAGSIDSIAGGGGLITVPTFLLLLGPGAHAIGTNKVCGSLSTLIALVVYGTRGHIPWRFALPFSAITAVGSVLGAWVGGILPARAYLVLLCVTFPVMLYLVFRKDFWTEALSRQPTGGWARPILYWLGLACGFYDGVWGPGGGTLMFLGLLVVGKLPLMAAIGASKLANFASAFTSLGGYALIGKVLWRESLWIAGGVVIGAVLGSLLASKTSGKVARPILAVVAVLLLSRVLLDFWWR